MWQDIIVFREVLFIRVLEICLVEVLLKQILAASDIWWSRASGQRLNILERRSLTVEQGTGSVIQISCVGAMSFVMVLISYCHSVLIRQINILTLAWIRVKKGWLEEARWGLVARTGGCIRINRVILVDSWRWQGGMSHMTHSWMRSIWTSNKIDTYWSWISIGLCWNELSICFIPWDWLEMLTDVLGFLIEWRRRILHSVEIRHIWSHVGFLADWCLFGL